MEIISIQINEGALNYVYSPGVTPEVGLRVCAAVLEGFRRQAMEAEVERRVRALTPGQALTPGPSPGLPKRQVAGEGGGIGDG